MLSKSLLLAFGLILAACVFEFRPEAPFVGSYQLTPDCELKIDDSSASAACTSGETVQISYSSGSITVENVSVAENLSNTECWVARNCTKTYSGTIENKGAEGSLYEGRFGRFTGSWVGQLVMKTVCTKQHAVTDPPEWCIATTEDRTYNIGAEVTAHEATVSWSTNDGADGEMKAYETQGGVTVAEEFYKRLGDDATSPDAGAAVVPDTATQGEGS